MKVAEQGAAFCLKITAISNRLHIVNQSNPHTQQKTTLFSTVNKYRVAAYLIDRVTLERATQKTFPFAFRATCCFFSKTLTQFQLENTPSK